MVLEYREYLLLGAMDLFPYQRQEIIWLVVDYEFIGKGRFLQQGGDETIIADERCVMGVAANDDWHIVAFAQV